MFSSLGPIWQQQLIADPGFSYHALHQCYIAAGRPPIIGNLPSSSSNETLVFTTRRLTEKRVIAQVTVILLHNVKPKRLFGLKSLWRGSSKYIYRTPRARWSI